MAADPARVTREGNLWRATYSAMASPCEILVDARCGRDQAALDFLVHEAVTETHRLESHLSRYRPGNIIHEINNANGRPVTVDEETADLLDFADRCWRLSEGRFDITSGVLRRAWTFDGGDALPAAETVSALLPRVGWDKVRWERPVLTVPAGMEIDLGGIGKEYAVDRVAGQLGRIPALVNFGGDLRVCGPRPGGEPWRVGVERPDREGVASLELDLREGALATSGDARRFVLRDGVRYGHILDPATGWPVAGAPRSVTVLAGSCTEAGLLATLAMLAGAGAEAFLKDQAVRHWILR